MHLTKILGSLVLAATALASPLVFSDVALAKRGVETAGQAGAYIKAPKDVEFTLVYGTVAMPDISKAADGSIVAYWIGIDGFGTGRVIQAGFDAEKDKHGKVTYQPWYEWYDNPKTNIDAKYFTAGVGEEVSITIAISAAGTKAVAAFVNKSTEQSYDTPYFYSPGEEFDSKGINAQWVIESVPENKNLANFGEIKFTGCSAADKGGYLYKLTGGTPFDLVRDGKKLASGAIASDTEVDITYTG